MTKSDLLNPRRMFEHACAFADCAKYCETEPNNIELRMRSHTVSGIVNSAFSCEVFIKALLVFHGKELRGHNLKTLWLKFKAVDCETACLIEERIREWFRSESPNLFDKLLNNASNAFEYWRYIYEEKDGDLNINFLRGFRIALKEACCNQLFGQSWDEYKEGIHSNSN